MVGKNNLWTMVAEAHKADTSANNSGLDWSNLEGLFCQVTVPNPATGGDSPKIGVKGTKSAGSGTDSLDKKKLPESKEVRQIIWW